MKLSRHFNSQVAQARYMSSSMLTFALLRNSSDLHIYKDFYGERNKPDKNVKLPLNYNKNRPPEFPIQIFISMQIARIT